MERKQLRERFASRAGFILMAAGCAIGLGNVWRFSYIAGQYGGGYFVLLYLLFLVILGFPVMVMELAVGRAGRSTFPGAFRKLRNPECRFRWHRPVYVLFCGNLILLMFYTVVTGWLLLYAWGFCRGEFLTADTADCAAIFQKMLDDPVKQTVGMLAGILVSAVVCAGGVRQTLEKAVKFMMTGLFVLLALLVIQALRLPRSAEGLRFFLAPDWGRFVGNGVLETVHAAMAQAFFTLSLGIGSIAVCGSYTGREESLCKESCWIIALDTVVAIAAGLVIFPACAAFGVAPDAGPSLIFITLPNVFHNMAGGMFRGTLFFVFLAIAALSTLVAVFENLVAFGMDEWRWSRGKSCLVFSVALALLSLPCVLGFNLWKNFEPLGKGSNVLDLEDFVVSDNLLPLGALYITVFTLSRHGWGRENFYAEVNAGKGWKLPLYFAFYMRRVLPVLILLIWVIGLVRRFRLV